MKEISQSGENATLSLQWLNWADTDYIAARQLLRSGRIVPAVSLANTSIEKYLKCLHILLGKKVPHGHNIPHLYKGISSEISRLNLNSEFLNLLYKAYKLRYPDELEKGYNISLCVTKIMTELDFTVFEIRKGFKFKKEQGEVITPFDQFIDGNSEQLLDKNCYFGSQSREEFFKEVSCVYECRILPNGNLMEVTYLSDDVKDDREFMGEALVPNG